MKKSIVLAMVVCLAALSALFCAGCGSDDYTEWPTEGIGGGANEFLGMLNGKFPDKPSGVSVTNYTGTSITLTWQPASKADSGYRVYRGVAYNEWGSGVTGVTYRCANLQNYVRDDEYKRTLVAVVSSTSYTDASGLVRGMGYCYGVSAYNAYGETKQTIIQAETSSY